MGFFLDFVLAVSFSDFELVVSNSDLVLVLRLCTGGTEAVELMVPLGRQGTNPPPILLRPCPVLSEGMVLYGATRLCTELGGATRCL